MVPEFTFRLPSLSTANIIVDNARSHGSCSNKHSEMFSSSSTALTRSSLSSSSRRDGSSKFLINQSKRGSRPTFSRWASEEEFDLKRTDFAPRAPKSRDFDVSKSSSKNNQSLSMPVRRKSIEDPDILSRLHGSLGSLGYMVDGTPSTAALIAKALEDMDFLEEDLSSVQ